MQNDGGFVKKIYFNKKASVLKAFIIITFCILFAGNSGCSKLKSDNAEKYIDAVRTFADNVLTLGKDIYGEKHTPLFLDGFQGNG